MYLLYISVFLLISCNKLIQSNASDEKIVFDLASETVRINDKGVFSNIEIFQPVENSQILKEKIQSKYDQLKFYSFGKPTILAAENDLIFYFTGKGFYIQVEVLTKSQRDLIQDELEQKHSVDLNENQIKNLIPTKFECNLEIECDEFFYLDGSVLNTNEYPLKVYFNVTKNSKEMKCLQKIVREDEDDFSFDCHLSTHLSYSNKDTSIIGRSYTFNKSNVKNISPDYKLSQKIELLTERVSKLEKIVAKLVEANKSNGNNSSTTDSVETDTVDLETEDNSPYDE